MEEHHGIKVKNKMRLKKESMLIGNNITNSLLQHIPLLSTSRSTPCCGYATIPGIELLKGHGLRSEAFLK